MRVAALLLLAAAACVQAQSTNTPQHCSSIANPLGKSLCSKYVQFSRADDKYRIAKDWSNKDYPSCEYLLPPVALLPLQVPDACMLTPCPAADQCANITASCLVADMRKGKAGSICTPAARGTPCGDAGSMGICVRGNCEGEQLLHGQGAAEQQVPL